MRYIFIMGILPSFKHFLIIHDGALCDASVSASGIAEQEIDENSGTVTHFWLLVSIV